MSSITLTVTSFNGAPSEAPLSAHFDELGGLIGRANTNQLVLPDPDRSISRVHAQVVFRGQHYAIVDRGSNPILINGQPAGDGREVPLRDGDRITIGGYELVAALVAGGRQAAASPADPFADLLGAPPAPGPAGPRRAALIDPLAGLAAAPPSARRRAPAPAAPSAASGIPDDWNPFAPDPVRPSATPAAAARDTLGLDLGAAAPAALIPDLPGSSPKGDTLDALFGLRPGGGGGEDPFARSALDQPIAQPNMASNADPLKSLGSAPRATAETAADTLSDLQRPFVAPPAVRPTPSPVAAPASEPPAAEPPAPLIPGAVLSWDAGSGDSHTVIRAPSRRETVPEPVQAPPPPPAPAAVEPSAPVPAPRAVAASSPADTQALHDAFLDGLGLPDLKFDGLTPASMRLIGQLLREAAGGTVDLLVARATLKREMHAEVTMIDARRNNPLKFSPSAEVALQHLLAPPARGFMPAAPAMRDAYADLRAHQFGMIAGMRAALEGVLERFDPDVLEGQLTQRSMLHSLLPGSRKARMWEVFVEHFDRIRAEASDDFQTLFGRAFLKAYEQHLDQIDKEDRP